MSAQTPQARQTPHLLLDRCPPPDDDPEVHSEVFPVTAPPLGRGPSPVVRDVQRPPRILEGHLRVVEGTQPGSRAVPRGSEPFPLRPVQDVHRGPQRGSPLVRAGHEGGPGCDLSFTTDYGRRGFTGCCLVAYISCFPRSKWFWYESRFYGVSYLFSELQRGRYTIGDTSRTGYLVLVGFDDLVSWLGSLAAECRRRLPSWCYVAGVA